MKGNDQDRLAKVPKTGNVVVRPADKGDLLDIVRLLAADPLGARRESSDKPLNEGYADAFASIEGDANNELLVASDHGAVVGVLQLTFIPGLTYRGGWRALVEGVRVAESHRLQGVGRMLIEHATDRACQRKCRILQLTTDKRRPEAVRFYEGLGFVASHEGMKLHLIGPANQACRRY